MAEESDAPGWDAIDDALEPIYGSREPKHYGTVLPAMFGGPDPLHGISAYRNVEPVPHWHFVTYGFTELWEKESDDPEVSGYGFELTFRLVHVSDDDDPPGWPISFLQNLGRYVFKTGNCFGVGHSLPLHGPICLGSPTLIHAAAFTADPQLPARDTPNGRVEFLQIVGLTMDELTTIESWDATAFLELRRKSDPLLATDLDRESWLSDPDFAAEVGRRTKAEGSSSGLMHLTMSCDTSSKPIRVRLQTTGIEGMKRRLLSRLPYGRDLRIFGRQGGVAFKPGERANVSVDENIVSITLTKEQAVEFSETIEPHVGTYAVPGLKNVVVEVLRTEIKDAEGRVVEVIE
jgi:suppressor of fused